MMSTQLAFPSLNDEQMQHVRQIGERIEFQAGDVLIRPGQKNYPFFVFETGEVEIVEQDDGEETLIATHGPGEFSGDVDMMTGRSSLFGARAKTAGVAFALRNRKTDSIHELSCSGLFIFIGARPHSDWLPGDVLLDEKGFVLTGSSFFANDELRKHWPLDRSPCELETTRPGILASGDVRSGTTKRCGFAVGDGSLAVTCVHRYLSK